MCEGIGNLERQRKQKERNSHAHEGLRQNPHSTIITQLNHEYKIEDCDTLFYLRWFATIILVVTSEHQSVLPVHIHIVFLEKEKKKKKLENKSEGK